jgi:uncharacterized protein YndB with AHSA1/START domain
MTPQPTGTFTVNGQRQELTLTRTFPAPAEDVWASVTESERTARWFGPWRGDAKPGGDIEVQMLFEEGAPWCAARIEQCSPPEQLALAMVDEVGEWHLELRLTPEGDGLTTLHLTQLLRPDSPIGEMGPGWEYYLDMLVASREDRPLPSFDDYYPSQRDWYQALR